MPYIGTQVEQDYQSPVKDELKGNRTWRQLCSPRPCFWFPGPSRIDIRQGPPPRSCSVLPKCSAIFSSQVSLWRSDQNRHPTRAARSISCYRNGFTQRNGVQKATVISYTHSYDSLGQMEHNRIDQSEMHTTIVSARASAILEAVATVVSLLVSFSVWTQSSPPSQCHRRRF